MPLCPMIRLNAITAFRVHRFGEGHAQFAVLSTLSETCFQNFSRKSKRKSLIDGKVPRMASLLSPPGISMRMQS